MHYSSLSDPYRKAIDGLHEMIMKHRRTMLAVESMAPQRLDASHAESLPKATAQLRSVLSALAQDLSNLAAQAAHQQGSAEKALTNVHLYGQWPLEAVAVRRGINLSSLTATTTTAEEKKEDASGMQAKIRALLDRQMVYVDRVERMPSPYLVQTVSDMEARLQKLLEQAQRLERELQWTSMYGREPLDVLDLAQRQHQALWHLGSKLEQLHVEMERVRYRYQVYERDENVIDKANQQEAERQRNMDEAVMKYYLKAGSTTASSAPAPTPGAPAPSMGFGFSSTPAPAPSTSFSFGGSSTPAPAPSTGFSFGSTPAPAAPAPATTGFGFGAPAPGPAGGGPAPAPSAFSFSSTPKKKSSSSSSSRSSGRLRR